MSIDAILENLIGRYNPILDSAGNAITGLAGVDFFYITKALILLIVIYCTFYIIGNVVKNLFR